MNTRKKFDTTTNRERRAGGGDPRAPKIPIGVRPEPPGGDRPQLAADLLRGTAGGRGREGGGLTPARGGGQGGAVPLRPAKP